MKWGNCLKFCLVLMICAIKMAVGQQEHKEEKSTWLQLETIKSLPKLNTLSEMEDWLEIFNLSLSYQYEMNLVIHKGALVDAVEKRNHDVLYTNAPNYAHWVNTLNQKYALVIRSKQLTPLYQKEGYKQDSLVIKVGKFMPISGTPYSLKFIKVLNDSRCPKTRRVQCVWEGDANILIGLKHQNNEHMDTIVLNSLDRTGVKLHHLNLVLASLHPKPRVSSIRSSSYKAFIKTNFYIDTAAFTLKDTPITDTLKLNKGFQFSPLFPDFKIKIRKVVHDSRCPQNAKCKWEGNAEVHVRVIFGKKKVDYILNTNKRYIKTLFIDNVKMELEYLSRPKLPLKANYHAKLSMTAMN